MILPRNFVARKGPDFGKSFNPQFAAAQQNPSDGGVIGR